MKTIRYTFGLVSLMFLFSNLLMAEADRNILIKRWKVVKHQKSNKELMINKDDFIQLNGNGVYEQSHNNFYTKGSWALNADELTINNNGEYVWKIISMTDSKMSMQRGVDEFMELEKIKLPDPVSKTSSAPLNYLCNGKWRPNEHHRGEVALKFQVTDVINFYADGSYERILNGKFSKGTWALNKEETELTIDAIIWKIENLTALFFKISKISDPKEFMIFAKTR